jgi:hypothetical protein
MQPNSSLEGKRCEGYEVMQGIPKREENGLRDLLQQYQRTDTVSSTHSLLKCAESPGNYRISCYAINKGASY